MTYEPDETPQGETPNDSEASFAFPRVTSHSWKSKGQEVYCVTCDNPHGFTLRVGTHMVGMDNGQPVFATVFDVPAEDISSAGLSSSGDDTSL